MKTNMPVTQNEVQLRDDILIVSKTDLKGQISYINKDFLEVSGFTESELIGEPHNIVRHPDMPVEAFQDLWDTLKAGRPWTGLVKNRCKNGDYYWVLANATPIWEAGQVTGYLSVRRKPDREAVAAHEAVYRQFREKRQGGLQIRCGRAVKGSGGAMAAIADWSVGTRMGAMLCLLGLLVLTVVISGIVALSRTNESMESLYEQRLEPVRVIGRIGKLMADNRTQILLALQHDPTGAYASLHDHPATLHADIITKNIAEITELWKDYSATVRDDEQRKLADAYAEARKPFVAEGLTPARQAMLDGKYHEANLILLQKINPAYTVAAGKADELFKYLSESAKTQFTESQTRYQGTRSGMIAAILLFGALGAFGAVWLVRSVKRPLIEIVDTLNNVAQGNYSNAIDVTHNNEMGKVLQGLQSMQTRLGFEVSETKRTADEMTRIKIALYSSTAAITISDAEGLLKNMTPTAERLLKAIAGQDAAALVDR
ncbi:MAG: MCP four helix bundle domain-containing protein, partial [Rhodocyclaceae bacterium]|nr:MCP four helix bundle domain-containing protein [Rhodocyclaceae bacterium]